jgi:hypothetical protein
LSHIRQYVYFAVRSDAVNADEVSRRLGLEPDHIAVRGSRSAEPPRPVANVWKIVCDEPDMTIDEQVEVVLQRLRPAEARLVELAKDPGCSVALQLVRYFGDEEGEPERLSDSDAGCRSWEVSISSSAGTSAPMTSASSAALEPRSTLTSTAS